MNPPVVLGVCFGSLVLVVSYLSTVAMGPNAPPWADAAGQAIRLYRTVTAVVVGPPALYADRLDLARGNGWVPLPVYYLIAVLFLSILIAFIYLVRRLTTTWTSWKGDRINRGCESHRQRWTLISRL